ncbi:MAG: hypothetical protein IJ643_04460 [Eubacterium sp.]|nr:hypothetical protein [Eubacterium sp.]
MKIKINTSGAAFHDENDAVLDRYVMAEQLKDVFKKIVADIQQGKDEGVVLDINGNKCCTWEA